MIKGVSLQEDITFINNIYVANIGTPKYIKQILKLRVSYPSFVKVTILQLF